MKTKTRAAYDRIQRQIDDEGAKLKNKGEWKDLLENIAGHVAALLDCIREEEKGD